ncbi:SCO2195 family GlnR-regulated protein [Actinacidiphila bryophytorum]|uniref:SCO2195 family GlnR-regulated protein n=1 Tax=Actinacidiphila bryophytorum TaxID=1436133 RepID=UPI002176A2B3|nr:hypothetical protein [Actinacidiphila bryophytorum]UWE08840.1 hypothetical protein NYE86_08970 [Actinacidiphila bryophytorum]
MPSESVHARPSFQLPTHTPVAGALRAVESFLLRGGQQTARRNAWASVVADRQRAKDRREAEHEMAALLTEAPGDAVRD